MKRALWPQVERKTYYFAFGANLCRDVLEQRRIKVFETFDYVLQDASLQFTQPGFYKDHGYASANVSSGQVVYGRMYLILERDARRMDYFEGVPFFRVHEKITRQADGFSFYFYRATRAVAGLKPTRDYLDYIVNAYLQMPIVPADYLASIRQLEVLEYFAPLEQTGVFVSDLDRWPNRLHPVLIGYERLCSKMVEVLWHRSLLQWLIRT